MKNIFIYIFVVFLLSCSSSKQKKKIIGKWYSSEEKKIISEFHFYKDSLVMYEPMGKFTLKWHIEEKKVFTSFQNGKGPTYNYKLDENSELLNLQLMDDPDSNLITLVKAKNAFDFFQKTMNMRIELPKNDSELIFLNRNNTSFNIYIGYRNKKLVVKTDKSKGLKNLEKDFNDFKKHSRDELKPFLKFNLVADKNIPVSQIDSIKNRIKKTFSTPVYRTYKNDQINYKNNLNWFGKIE